MLLLLSVVSACVPTPVETLAPESEPTTPPAQAQPTETQALPSPTTEVPPSETPFPSPEAGETPEAGGGATPEGIAQPGLTFLDMKDENAGWGLANIRVLRTGDGGAAWFDVTPVDMGNETPPLAFFLDADRGWVLSTSSGDPESGRLFRTADSGASWETLVAPFGFAQLFFLDADAGWALVDRGAGAGSQAVDIYRTLDGGASWEPVFQMVPEEADPPGALPLSGIKNGISFNDLDHGWVGGSIPMDGFTYLYSSADGGATWEHVELPLPAGFENAQTTVWAPVFFTPQEGILPVTLFSDVMGMVFYVTRDGGATWTPGGVVENGGPFAIGSSQDLFVWGESGLSASHDGGATWTTLQPEPDLREILGSLEFAGPSRGWATTMDLEGNTLLYHTRDGGETWRTE
jgi:photosystem II stability/assembly factor-like uncharacterized protein